MADSVTPLGYNATGNPIVRYTMNVDDPESPTMVYALTLCCNASDKGVEDGVVCRSCYSDQNMGDMWDLTIVRDSVGNAVAPTNMEGP